MAAPSVAKTLTDLHDARATFNFCGGMMFQLVLTDTLRSHLAKVAADGASAAAQPKVFDSSIRRMSRLPNYTQNALADNVEIFHGREIRKVATAAGGMGFVLQLSHSEDDPEGWTSAEVTGYDGWGHDSGRTWRDCARYEKEGVEKFRERFGDAAFGLHHRFYFHIDDAGRLWLSAEDGCEGFAPKL